MTWCDLSSLRVPGIIVYTQVISSSLDEVLLVDVQPRQTWLPTRTTHHPYRHGIKPPSLPTAALPFEGNPAVRCSCSWESRYNSTVKFAQHCHLYRDSKSTTPCRNSTSGSTSTPSSSSPSSPFSSFPLSWSLQAPRRNSASRPACQ